MIKQNARNRAYAGAWGRGAVGRKMAPGVRLFHCNGPATCHHIWCEKRGHAYEHEDDNHLRLLLREADNNLGWARVSINGTSDGKQLMPDDNRDLCEICWSPLQTLMKKVHDEAREKRNSSGEA
jgi:hypothetical protein